MLDVSQIRQQFPILHQEVNGYPLVYLDNGATTHKPKVVIDAIQHYYEKQNSNIHRGVHYLSQLATDEYEASRETVRQHFNAEHLHEIIFTKGNTEAINLVANGFRALLSSTDEVLVSAMEHHSNIVPWQMACQSSGATLKVIPMNNKGELDMLAYQNLLSSNTKVVAVNHISNALGTINPDIEVMLDQDFWNTPFVT